MIRILARLTRRSKAGSQAEVTPPPVSQPAPVSDPAPLLFDPSAHTVAEVRRYLAAHPNDRDRIHRLERRGKKRSSILNR